MPSKSILAAKAVKKQYFCFNDDGDRGDISDTPEAAYKSMCYEASCSPAVDECLFYEVTEIKVVQRIAIVADDKGNVPE